MDGSNKRQLLLLDTVCGTYPGDKPPADGASVPGPLQAQPLPDALFVESEQARYIFVRKIHKP